MSTQLDLTDVKGDNIIWELFYRCIDSYCGHEVIQLFLSHNRHKEVEPSPTKVLSNQ